MDQDPGAPPEGTTPEGTDPEKVVREPTEGVRIIGAEEAAEAEGRSDVVSRLPADRPKFGDRPTSADETPPPLRFPAPDADDPNTFGAVPIISADTPPPPGLGGPPSSSGSSPSTGTLGDDVEPVFAFDDPGQKPPPVNVEGGPNMASDEEDLGRMLGGRRERKDDTSSRRRGRRGRRGRRDEPEPSGFDDLLPTEHDLPVADEHDLPDWTRPPTGEVPKVLAPDGGDEAVWSGLGSQPRWRDDHGHDEVDDFADLSDQTSIDAAPAAPGAPVGPVFDDFGEIPPPPERPAPVAVEVPVDEPDPADVSMYQPEPEPVVAAEPSHTPGSPYPEARHQPGTLGSELGGSGAGRDLPQAAMVGAGLFIGFVVLCFLGSAFVTVLVLVVIVMAVIEFFNAVRRVGYHPAVLPGLVATGAFVLAVHWKGEPAFLLVTFLTLVVLMLWYVIGLQHERAVANIGITFFGVMWIGGLGSFAALLLALPNGIGLLAGAVIATVAYDVGAYAVGRQFGKTPISPLSPNKTMEGLLGGAVATVIVSAVVLGVVGIFPWQFGDAIILGLAVAIVAPLGDLCESMLKRDLGLKDMGSILPGHGGLLDRFDALLFVLPVTYFVVRVLDVLDPFVYVSGWFNTIP